MGEANKPARERIIHSRGNFLLSVLFSISFCSAFLSLSFALGPVEGVVKRVVDGDTVELTGGELVRYAGIDAPELRRLEEGRWVEAPEAFGVSAYRLNQRLVEDRHVRLEFDETRGDDYHRLLVYLYVDGFLVNAIMIREGLASVSLYPPNLKYADLFLSMQRRAWEERRGIWSKPSED
jgi:micrococcal nuclease